MGREKEETNEKSFNLLKVESEEWNQQNKTNSLSSFKYLCGSFYRTLNWVLIVPQRIDPKHQWLIDWAFRSPREIYWQINVIFSFVQFVKLFTNFRKITRIGQTPNKYPLNTNIKINLLWRTRGERNMKLVLIHAIYNFVSASNHPVFFWFCIRRSGNGQAREMRVIDLKPAPNSDQTSLTHCKTLKHVYKHIIFIKLLKYSTDKNNF